VVKKNGASLNGRAVVTDYGLEMKPSCQGTDLKLAWTLTLAYMGGKEQHIETALAKGVGWN